MGGGAYVQIVWSGVRPYLSQNNNVFVADISNTFLSVFINKRIIRHINRNWRSQKCEYYDGCAEIRS